MKPKICPHCGSEDIGQLDSGFECRTEEEYQKMGGRYYCVACGKAIEAETP